MTLVAAVDLDACLAHGDCAEVAPDVFRVGQVAEIVGTAGDDVLLAAAEACPSVAIALHDPATGKRVYP